MITTYTTTAIITTDAEWASAGHLYRSTITRIDTGEMIRVAGASMENLREISNRAWDEAGWDEDVTVLVEVHDPIIAVLN